MSRYLTPADLGPVLEAQWRSLPADPTSRQNWSVPWWPATDTRHRPPCRTCGGPLHPDLAELGHDEHPCCGDDSWWTAEAFEQAEVQLAATQRDNLGVGTP